jgi:penicillin amidase
MRLILAFSTGLLCLACCFYLNTTYWSKVALGSLLSPQEGIWQNAEPLDYDFSEEITIQGIKGQADVYFDERLVPHVFADQESDAFFIQGYLHAKFRLWQMELQVFAAAGRASEIVGNVAIDHDREFRRLGMVYAAENSLKEIEKDPATRSACDAYTAGVNAYIQSLTKSSLPLEYKLLGYRPELWTNLKSALFLKYMSYDLAGRDNDFEMTLAKSFFNEHQFNLLFPQIQDSLDPIIPSGTVFSEPARVPAMPVDADSVYFNFKKAASVPLETEKPDRENGSNNWALSGIKTKSGAPILCNDPHLGLNLPSLWFEMQMTYPGCEVYGVSFPGAPGIIIGYNNQCAFGFTNSGRDVRDYYEIKFKDDTRREYLYNNNWLTTKQRIERIKVKGEQDIVDTVAYTEFGPVMYDASYQGKKKISGGKSYAVRWKAHDGSNELKFFYLLDHAQSLQDYQEALKYLEAPGQNCVFASKNGDVAMYAAGSFPAKWKGQGDFIMPGWDSSYAWQGNIPFQENPFQINPERGFVSSANQRTTDSTYPYYLGKEYPLYRGIDLNHQLSQIQQANITDMMKLQTSNYSIFAATAAPFLFKFLAQASLTPTEQGYFSELKSWNFNYDAEQENPTLFDLTWNALYDTTFHDEYQSAPSYTAKPFKSTLLEAILRDTTYEFLDDIRTPEKETLENVVLLAFRKAVIQAEKFKQSDRMIWWKYKDTYVNHLLKLPAFSKGHLNLGGCVDALNAVKSNHGPSWRMIVSLTRETEAFGVFPGGQSGNPGSKYYDDAVEKWAQGRYNRLWFMRITEVHDSRVRFHMQFKGIS